MSAPRKLAAILAADVVGYSRLTGVDEEGTLKRLRKLRRDLINPAVSLHRGRIVKTTGDGILIEFPSVVEAVRCALHFQRGMDSRNSDVPTEQRIEFRVGINLGDVVIEGEDLLGDGVNVAARLEAISEPGGICISDAAYHQVCDKVDVDFEDAGEQQLKNIARPVRIYRARLDRRLAQAKPALPLPDKPSIAVLPFQNMSGDPEQEYFADGIVDDIITALTRMRWLFIIARNSSFTYKGRAVDVKQVGRELGVRYVLEGGVRKSANRIRITTQLIDATTGAHIWAERYDRDLTDIFAVQDEITECVAAAIEPELLKIEGCVAIARTENLSAWDTVRQGMWHFHQVRRENAFRARELFREAIKLDPKLPEAHLWLGRISGSLLAYGWSSDRTADLREGTEAALKAVQLDERNPYAQYALAITSVWAGALERATRAAETAIALSPSFALGHLALGLARLSAGKAAEAIAPNEHALRLSPFDPQNFAWLGNLALAQYFAGSREAALQTAMRALAIRPGWVPTLETLAICCAALERFDEARGFVEQMCQLEKPPDVFAPMKAHKPEWAAEMASMLRKAGLPD
ncbi:MAG: adenylate/guanylate cyclase domain-containing protein [Alphaproteobacteria bacterium]|nr:MAG: adenylate/guanylate cyclase domain-containing protein [Alphaproteobacteria bacterium]